MFSCNLFEVGEISAGGNCYSLPFLHTELFQKLLCIHSAYNSSLLLSVNSILPVPPDSTLLFNAGMKENKAVRRANLLGLIKEFDTIEALANATGTVAAYLSQVKNGTRQMGDRVARRIEAGLNKDEGWIDVAQYGGLDSLMDQSEILEIMRALTPEERDEVLKLARLIRRARGVQDVAEAYGKLPEVKQLTHKKK